MQIIIYTFYCETEIFYDFWWRLNTTNTVNCITLLTHSLSITALSWSRSMPRTGKSQSGCFQELGGNQRTLRKQETHMDKRRYCTETPYKPSSECRIEPGALKNNCTCFTAILQNCRNWMHILLHQQLYPATFMILLVSHFPGFNIILTSHNYCSFTASSFHCIICSQFSVVFPTQILSAHFLTSRFFLLYLLGFWI